MKGTLAEACIYNVTTSIILQTTATRFDNILVTDMLAINILHKSKTSTQIT